ncbi:MAG: hypothetical protein JNL01_12640 [Bdellovibrionales bacterium]|nr:hypothetical protein [Bdellovibrionales bacterium]
MDQKTVQRAIQRLVDKFQGTSEFFREDDTGLSLRQLHFQARKFSREIAKAISSGTYLFSQSRAVVQRISGKDRTLFRMCWSDRIVHSVFAFELARRLEPRLGSRLFSYRKGLGPERAIRSLCRFLHRHRKSVLNPKDRGIFVYRADISAYGESISVLPDARIWKVLAKELGNESIHWLPKLQAAVDPSLRFFTSPPTDSRVKTGVPTGSALVPVFNNLFLLDLDRKISGIADVFYLRYGDDLCVASTRLDSFKKAVNELESEIQQLGLSVSEKNSYYWTGCGRAPEKSVSAQGTQWIELLGSRISFQGRISPTKEKQARMKRLLKRRLTSAFLSARFQNLAPLQTLVFLINAAKNFLDPTHPFSSPQAVLWKRPDRDEIWIAGMRRWVRIWALSKSLGRPFRPKILARWPTEAPLP